MIILGIETSCDDTGVAIYDTEAGLRAHTLASQVELHQPYGGIVPELAARDHIQTLRPLIIEVLIRAKVKPAQINAVDWLWGQR